MKAYLISALSVGILGIQAANAACGQETVNGVVTNYCESHVQYVGVGANGSTLWSEGVVYATLSDDGSWFWDNSTAKNMTLSTLLAAKAAKQKVQVRWVSGAQALGEKKITSVLILP